MAPCCPARCRDFGATRVRVQQAFSLTLGVGSKLPPAVGTAGRNVVNRVDDGGGRGDVVAGVVPDAERTRVVAGTEDPHRAKGLGYADWRS